MLNGKNESITTVHIDDGAIQCETSGRSALGSAQLLINSAVDVINSQCGLSDSNITLHSIFNNNLSDAQALGFESAASLRQDDAGYAVIEVPLSKLNKYIALHKPFLS